MCDRTLTWRNVEKGAPSPSFAMKAGAYLRTMLSWAGNFPTSRLAQGVFMARTVTFTRPPESARMICLLAGSMVDRYFLKSKVAILEGEDMVFHSAFAVMRNTDVSCTISGLKYWSLLRCGRGTSLGMRLLPPSSHPSQSHIAQRFISC